MALIQHLGHMERNEGELHKPVDAKYGVFERDGLVFVQIDTYGQPGRQIPGKTSQSIQFDEASAIQMIRILKDAFKIN